MLETLFTLGLWNSKILIFDLYMVTPRCTTYTGVHPGILTVSTLFSVCETFGITRNCMARVFWFSASLVDVLFSQEGTELSDADAYLHLQL